MFFIAFEGKNLRFDHAVLSLMVSGYNKMVPSFLLCSFKKLKYCIFAIVLDTIY